jgi:mannitol/fructose-specific phosphotransferase system IIA component (Ntr-type)
MLRELTERKRAAEAEQKTLQASENDEVDNKENVLQQASKRLIDDDDLDNKENVLQQASKRQKIAEASDDGFVIPKLEPE